MSERRSSPARSRAGSIAVLTLFAALVLAAPACAAGWYLSNAPTGGGTLNVFAFGFPSDVPLAGDWNGDGTDTVAVYHPRTAAEQGWDLARTNGPGGGALTSFAFGFPADLPVVGDWNGDGTDTVGIFRFRNPADSGWALASANAAGGGSPTVLFYGKPGDLPIVGDWNGDGIDTVGIFRRAAGQPQGWALAGANTTHGGALNVFFYGEAGDAPIAGDWNGDGIDTVGVFRPRASGSQGWALAGSNATGGGAFTGFAYGEPGDVPVVGDWDADGVDSPGIFRANADPVAQNAVPNGHGASRAAKLAASYTRTRKRSQRMGFGSRPTIEGRLVDERGRAITGAAIAVLTRRRQAGADPVQIASVTTAGDGSFSYRLPSGPSRAVTFTYTAYASDSQPASSSSLNTLVRASLSARISPRSPFTGAAMKLTGRLRHLPSARVAVTIQALDGRKWRTIGEVRTRADGRYLWRYRFKSSAAGRVFAFRAQVNSPIYPFAKGHSRVLKVPVR